MPLLPYNIVPSRSERTYLTEEATFGTFITPTNTDAVRSYRCVMTPSVPLITRRDKTGSLSQTAGIKGRVYGTWEIEMSLTGNGVAGNLPDAAILLNGAFGQAAVATPMMTPTSQVWNLSDAAYSFDLWSYRNINGSAGSNLQQRVAGSCVVSTLEINFGGDFATLTARGDCLFIMDNLYFASVPSTETAEKGGMMSFPAEPGAPVTNGYPAPGFVGVISIDTHTIAEVKTGNITINTGRRLVRDTFGSYVPTGIEADVRSVLISFDTDDTDSSNLADLKVKSMTKAPIAYSITLGNVSGNEFVFSANNLILNPPAIEDANIRYRARFPQSFSFASSYTAKDELVLTAQ